MQEHDQAFITQQANDWLVKLETGDMLAGDEDRFVAWLEQDERHGEAFHEAEQTWQLMHEASNKHSQKTVASILQQSKNSWFKQHLLSIAATVLLSFITMLWWQQGYYSLMSDHYTLTGERQEKVLEDGSVLTLNTDSAVDIRFEKNIRLVEVLSGEVHVAVAPNPQKPFVVKAGTMKVTALGTAFIVSRTDKLAPKVTVTEHSVKVESETSNHQQLVLEEGQQVALQVATDKLSSVKQVNSSLAKAWLKGKYVFQDESFEAVIRELERYYDGKILIQSSSLKGELISGVLDIDNPLDSLTNLKHQLQFNVTKVTPYLIVISKG
ncbi:FecR family protein [Thalassotalea fusca]